MTRIDRCLREIQAIREVAHGTAAPYVARSRIGRLVLSTAVLVAEEAGLPCPDIPHRIRPPEGASDEVATLAVRSSRLAELSRHIAQPSEPLADRWQRGWHELLTELDLLEQDLR